MDNNDIEDLSKIIVDLEKRVLINEKEIKHLKIFMEAVYKILSKKK